MEKDSAMLLRFVIVKLAVFGHRDHEQSSQIMKRDWCSLLRVGIGIVL